MTCAICLDAVDEAEATTLPCAAQRCRSHFHGACIRRWLEQKPQCPLCKRRARASGSSGSDATFSSAPDGPIPRPPLAPEEEDFVMSEDDESEDGSLFGEDGSDGSDDMDISREEVAADIEARQEDLQQFLDEFPDEGEAREAFREHVHAALERVREDRREDRRARRRRMRRGRVDGALFEVAWFSFTGALDAWEQEYGEAWREQEAVQRAAAAAEAQERAGLRSEAAAEVEAADSEVQFWQDARAAEVQAWLSAQLGEKLACEARWHVLLEGMGTPAGTPAALVGVLRAAVQWRQALASEAASWRQATTTTTTY